MGRIFQDLVYAAGGRLETWPPCGAVGGIFSMGMRTRPASGTWRFLLAAVFSLITSLANAETIDITGDRGGLLFFYQQKWEKVALKHPNVRITGLCVSACTVLLGYVPRKNICVTDKGVLGFHLATMEFATKQLLEAYPDDIKTWIDKHGGLTHQVLWLQAPEIFHYFQKCPDE
jgi:hypothetical protein